MHRSLFALALVPALALPATAGAQTGTWELALQGGALHHDVVEETGTDPLASARLARYTDGGWGLGASLDWARGSERRPGEGTVHDVDLTRILYAFTVDRTFAPSPRTRLALGTGIGGATAKWDGLPAPTDGVFDESGTALLVPVGAGLKFLNRAAGPSWAIRLDVRDNLVFQDDVDPAGRARDGVAQLWQASAGLSLFFGGRPPARVADAPLVAPETMRPVVDTDDESSRRAAAMAEIRTPIYFDFDRSDLKEPARGTLQTKGDVLREWADLDVVIEGHADERGTIEYNLALGERRAEAARRYLIDLGIDADRLSTVSYGEERPAVAGQGESAWSRNRRDEFVPVESNRAEAVPRG